MTRDKLFKRQNGRCFYCGEPMKKQRFKKIVAEDGYTVDHFVPKSLGGNSGGNKVLCHNKCNSRKGNRLPTDAEIDHFMVIYGPAKSKGMVKQLKRARRNEARQ